MLKFHDISRAGTVGIFLWNKLTSLKWLKFHMHVSDDDSNMFCKFDEIWWILNFFFLKFHYISRAGTVGIFEWNKLTSLNGLKFDMHVYDDSIWWNFENFEKMLKFHYISRAGTVGIFLWNKLTSLNGLKFHMHVSDDDSNMFCKFDESWWILKKCWNFILYF